MRKHYMTICLRNNVEVTHIMRNNRLEITFEEAVTGGFKTLVLLDDLTVISNNGFNDAEVAYYREFTRKSLPVMIKEARGLL